MSKKLIVVLVALSLSLGICFSIALTLLGRSSEELLKDSLTTGQVDENKGDSVTDRVGNVVTSLFGDDDDTEANVEVRYEAKMDRMRRPEVEEAIQSFIKTNGWKEGTVVIKNLTISENHKMVTISGTYEGEEFSFTRFGSEF